MRVGTIRGDFALARSENYKGEPESVSRNGAERFANSIKAMRWVFSNDSGVHRELT
jgi:hypothetical protein